MVEAFFVTSKDAVIKWEVPWMSGTIANLWQKMCTVRRKEKEKARPEEIPDSTPSPYQVAARSDAILSFRRRILRAVHRLPAPYGHVLFWQGILGLTHSEIHELLCKARSVSRDRTDCIVREAHEMFRVCEEGHDPRERWPQRYDQKKNAWIATPLPLLPGQS